MDDWQTKRFWGKPERHRGKAAALYVIGPYPTAEFLAKLKDALRPKKLIVAVDEGWSNRQIEGIARLVQKGLRYAKSRNGFVHAKLYLAVWGTSEKRTACLVWGSANASLGGFDRNAEAVSRLILNDDRTLTRVLRYFEKLENSKGKIDSLDIAVSQRLRVQLPAFSFYSDNKRSVGSFDAWIQAGILCYRFTPDSRFGHVCFKLKKELPRAPTEDIFVHDGFRRDTSTDSIRWAYCDVEAPDSGSASVPKWRAKYFVETWLGYWTSRECFSANENVEDGILVFRAKGEDRRQYTLDNIRNANRQEHTKWMNKFCESLSEVAKRLDKPDNFLHIINDEIDFNKYKKQVRKQLENQKRQAKDPVFRERYVSGHAFHSVPPLRESADDFDDLVKDVCSGILASIGKPKTNNALALTIRDLCFPDKDFSDWDATKLRKLLNETWSRHKDTILQYHESEQNATVR